MHMKHKIINGLCVWKVLSHFAVQPFVLGSIYSFIISVNYSLLVSSPKLPTFDISIITIILYLFVSNVILFIYYIFR